MYDKFNKKLPKYWVVRCTEDNLKEFRETVITYIRNVYSVRYTGGSDTYYGYDGNEGNKGIDWYTDSHFFINNPTILTLEEFKSYFEEFELPEKWCFKGSIEAEKFQKTVFEDKTNVVFMSKYYYWHDSSNNYKDKEWDHSSSIPHGYTKITFEQFKKHVLKLVEPEFILPEIWWVRVTDENRDILSKWRGLSKLYSGDGIVGMVKWKDGRIEKSHNPLNKIKCDDYDFGKEITFEQFKKYVLKQETMVKEIIGYKLKKDCEQYKEAAKRVADNSMLFQNTRELHGYDFTAQSQVKIDLEKTGVLDLWFEPVYKEEDFKVGDWVVVLDKGTSDLRVGDIGKITCLGADKSHPDFRVEARGITEVNWLEPKDVRLATPEEIAKAQSKELYFGEVKFTIESGKDYAVTEYGNVFKKEIKAAIDWVKNPPSLAGYKFTIHNTKSGKYEKLTDISTGCIEDTMIGFGCRYGKLSELEAIFKAFD